MSTVKGGGGAKTKCRNPVYSFLDQTANPRNIMYIYNYVLYIRIQACVDPSGEVYGEKHQVQPGHQGHWTSSQQGQLLTILKTVYSIFTLIHFFRDKIFKVYLLRLQVPWIILKRR